MLTLTASGSVSDYTDSDKSSLQEKVANIAGVDKSLVTIEVVAASVIITATIGVPTSTTAAAVEASLSSKLGTAAAASEELGITVESEPVITTTEELAKEEDSSSPVAIIVGVLVAVLAVCLLCACCCIMRKRQQNKPKHVTLNNPNAGGAAPGGKPTKGYQMAVKEQKDLAPNQA